MQASVNRAFGQMQTASPLRGRRPAGPITAGATYECGTLTVVAPTDTGGDGSGDGSTGGTGDGSTPPLPAGLSSYTGPMIGLFAMMLLVLVAQ